jgi:hypothetical protein
MNGANWKNNVCLLAKNLEQLPRFLSYIHKSPESMKLSTYFDRMKNQNPSGEADFEDFALKLNLLEEGEACTFLPSWKVLKSCPKWGLSDKKRGGERMQDDDVVRVNGNIRNMIGSQLELLETYEEVLTDSNSRDEKRRIECKFLVIFSSRKSEKSETPD